ncbi:YhcG family protein [cf. Phormidesmis sp. LEGE 11477]|uniref:PDDEXK nuclease domain-containing protein n=1 Tax=cf. Phormidesmis sp. LEGE 11477 TaxID=1828680 RepID=UPI0018829A4B|nr:PDDEXK nuclease domain-containing protein [cf. Phormidesmis sp. LEGE 11477]MBE9064374.1 DUF1016 family protein [cf. Phormidesmis sp. LEGE 11477]
MPDQTSHTHSETYNALLSGMTKRIQNARMEAALAVNQELIMLYWQIGKSTLEREQEGPRNEVVSRLAQHLKHIFPSTNIFSPQNLRYMRELAEAYPDEQLMQKAFIHIPWEHNKSLLRKLDSQAQRLWYARKATEYGWSHNILEMQIEYNRFSRQENTEISFEGTLPPDGSDMSRQLLENKHGSDLMRLKEAIKAANLKQALVNHIRSFLLNLRCGFALLGNKHRLDVGQGEFFADLLFYHTRLRRYIVIAIETGDFEPEFVGKMNFLINVVDDKMASEIDEPTVGIILCQSKNKTVAEYSLGTLKTTIGVSTYKREKKLPPNFSPDLPSVHQLEAELDLATQQYKML